ncbi:MAG TPA: Flp family type IVb pilin [Tepidisphaeraceae bacterium]|jgi:Flp pilus assembly pilin Flp
MRQYLRLLRLPAARRKRAMLGLAVKAFRDESGAEILEYSLILGLIVVGCITTVSCVGTKVLNRWNSVKSSI